VIDLGFNSLKMVIYETKGETVEVSGKHGVMAKLGEGLAEDGYLGEGPVKRTIDALNLLKEIADTESVYQILLVGTSPVREAENGTEFVKRVTRETGLRMKVLTAEEEALYSYLGAACSTTAQNIVFFDLGGGSLEMVSAKGHRIRKVISLPLGVLKLTQRFADRKGKFSKRNYALLRKRAWAQLPGRRQLGIPKNAVLVGVGGTLRALARYDQAGSDYPLFKVHNYEISADSVQKMAREFRRLSRAELAKEDPIGEDRAETISAGAAVVSLLMKRLGFSRLVVSTHGLRDGVLTVFRANREIYERRTLKRRDVRSILASRKAHESEVSWTPLSKTLGVAGIFTASEMGILDAAVHRISEGSFGTSPEVIFHSFLDEDSELDHHAQLIMSLAVARKVSPRLANWLFGRYSSLLGPDDKETVRRLSAALKLIEVLQKWSVPVGSQWRSGRLMLSIHSQEGNPPMSLLKAAAALFEKHVRVPVVLSPVPRREALLAGSGQLGVQS
jgi:exopolyphosphatase/guanosine-5'-triphosphate,3'-diphosphate pyrophosphatase